MDAEALRKRIEMRKAHLNTQKLSDSYLEGVSDFSEFVLNTMIVLELADEEDLTDIGVLLDSCDD